MTRWVFTGKHVDSYIDPQPEAFKYGTFMHVAGNPTGYRWFRCSPLGGTPHKHHWKPVDEWDVPKEYRAWVLIL